MIGLVEAAINCFDTISYLTNEVTFVIYVCMFYAKCSYPENLWKINLELFFSVRFQNTDCTFMDIFYEKS